jgi:hypothetical protein
MLHCRSCHDAIHRPRMRQVEVDLDRFQAAERQTPQV